MDYLSLKDVYYKDHDNWEKEYGYRFNSPFTKHFDFSIKQYHRKTSFPLFMCYPEELVTLLLNIYKKSSLLNKVIETIPPIGFKQFTEQSLIIEIKSTNDIEGVRSTRKEIKHAIEYHNSDRKNIRFKGIVAKYLKLLNKESIPFKTCQDIRNFYDAFGLDEVKLGDPDCVPDGLIFRKGPVELSTGTQKTIHHGVVSEENIIEMMNKSLTFLNDATVPLLIRIAVFHYLFGYIHPFYDGNGRTSRFISSYFLSKEFHPAVGLRLSIIVKKNINKYYEIFDETNSEINKGDATPFVIIFLQMVLDAILNAKTVLEDKIDQIQRAKTKLDSMKLGDEVIKNVYFILLQAALFSGSGASITEIASALKKNRATIQKRLDKIPNEHIVVNKAQKPYTYKLNLMILK